MKIRMFIYLMMAGLLFLSGCGKKTNRAATRVNTTGVNTNGINPNQQLTPQQLLLLQQQQQTQFNPLNNYNQQTGNFNTCEAYGSISVFDPYSNSTLCCDPLYYNCFE